MADLTLASMDLARGLKPKHLVVPDMSVEVLFKSPPKELVAAFEKDKLIGQKVQAAALAALKKARDDFQAAIAATDEAFSKKPPKDPAEIDERVKTLNTVCRQIAEAQAGVATAAAEAEWTSYVRKNKDLLKYRALFAVRMTLATISVAASLTHTVMSFGATSAIGILGIAKTVISVAADIRNQLRAIAEAEKDIINTDAALAAEWLDKVGAKDKLKRVGQELAAALGAPVVKSIIGLGKLLTEYNAKIAAQDNAAEKLWTQAKKLMDAVAAAQKVAGPGVKKDFDKLGSKVSELLDQIGAMSAVSKSQDQFHTVYLDRFNTYKKMQGEALGATASATGGLVQLASIAATLDTIVSIAQAIA